MAAVSDGQYLSGRSQSEASDAGDAGLAQVDRHQRTLRTRATAKAPANENAAPSRKTSMNEPDDDDGGGADHRRDRLRHGRGDVHDAEVFAARGGVGQHLRRERLVDREEAAVAEAEEPRADHRDREVGEEAEHERGDALAAPRR